MRITHRGVTVEMQEDDLRVALIEAMVFSKALPQPLMLALPESPASPPPMPPELLAFWKELSEPGRRELKLLAGRGRVSAREIESVIGAREMGLNGIHSRITVLTKKHGVRLEVKKWGQGSGRISYELRGEQAGLVAGL